MRGLLTIIETNGADPPSSSRLALRARNASMSIDAKALAHRLGIVPRSKCLVGDVVDGTAAGRTSCAAHLSRLKPSSAATQIEHQCERKAHSVARTPR